jgi:hypothetical protein
MLGGVLTVDGLELSKERDGAVALTQVHRNAAFDALPTVAELEKGPMGAVVDHPYAP